MSRQTNGGEPTTNSSQAVLNRVTFETSRALEYFSAKELQAQIGFTSDYWPVAILRELIDNALDACEGIGVAPDIHITTSDDTICVRDNGPGIPPQTIERSLGGTTLRSRSTALPSGPRSRMRSAMRLEILAPR